MKLLENLPFVENTLIDVSKYFEIFRIFVTILKFSFSNFFIRLSDLRKIKHMVDTKDIIKMIDKLGKCFLSK